MSNEAAKKQALKAMQQTQKAYEAHRENLESSVAIAREKGATWEEIGEALGVSKQAAHQRFAEGISVDRYYTEKQR